MVPNILPSDFDRFLDMIVPNVHTINTEYEKNKRAKDYFYEHAAENNFSFSFEDKIAQATANLHEITEPDWGQKNLYANLDYTNRKSDAHFKAYDPENRMGLHDKAGNALPHLTVIRSGQKEWTSSYLKDVDNIGVNFNIKIDNDFLQRAPRFYESDETHRKYYSYHIKWDTANRLRNGEDFTAHDFEEPKEKHKFLLLYQGQKAGILNVPFYGGSYFEITPHEDTHQICAKVAAIYKNNPRQAEKEFAMTFRDFQLYMVGTMFYDSNVKSRYEAHPEERTATKVGDAAKKYKDTYKP